MIGVESEFQNVTVKPEISTISNFDMVLATPAVQRMTDQRHRRKQRDAGRLGDDRTDSPGRKRLVEVAREEGEVGEVDRAVVVIVAVDPLRAALLVEVGREVGEVGEIDGAV